ncbi:MAG: carboxylating nicotinate-nucleotide diphosphorylase [Brevinematales bacterium]|nr:carboxylating nicotinate-nucleotide diphosphorylase [Brevinematales bacterium]
MRKNIDFPKKLSSVPQNIIVNLINISFNEDIKSGDVTALALLANKKEKAIIFAKEEGIVCGTDFIEKSFKLYDDETEVILLKKDGEIISKGERIAEIRGNVKSLLSVERTALNFVGFLSGIATKVYYYTKEIQFSNTKLLDTRKTIAGMRLLEKYAVSIGGGYNHRYGLYDMFLIKENHIKSVGSIIEAVKRAKEYKPDMLVEVEINSIEQLEEVLKTEAEIVMLDNMKDGEVKKAFDLLKTEKYVEVSGNVNKERLIKLAEIGVDFVSMGELTHTIKPLDISMLLE